ncbi:nicotinic acid mononucleotide adenyltransferase [Abyssalbus ytuae]|uniref:Nicotinic acid mononucleotide adenyltransferase n=1 Tax=Abyssalbus ytuae TaxID=2926907 RepID=A0A9E7A1C4_9FLAO|nr:nicotinic acid mononucleotide adenyltransferase [Abyssalbus ytuae]UOB19192.1 nicotinic acid mononucleotide adenyltransferase [Abyssalbus ytuae]
MKALKLLFLSFTVLIFTTSCYTEVVVEDDYIIDEPVVTLGEVLASYDLWYVNIHETEGNGEVPFLQKAFTVSFNGGVFMANNNLVGIGSTGNGLGIDVGYYGTSGTTLEVDHDIDGIWRMEVFQLNNNRIELYHRPTDTSYFLTGYLASNFDYDYVFYDNIHYFLQEYNVWEKTYVSEEGALNDFDNENFLSFLADGNDIFLSSIDTPGTPVNNLQWDYEGVYTVYDIPGETYLKTLTLDYDYFDNDYFELYVIDDRTIELYHPESGTVYEFTGRGYIQYLKNTQGKDTSSSRKRTKIVNKTMNVTRKGEQRKIKV